MPAAQVVEKGKEQKLKLDIGYVYGVRTAMRAKSSGTVVKKPALANGSRPVHTPESVLVSVAAEIGLSKAIETLQAHRKTVTDLLG